MAGLTNSGTNYAGQVMDDLYLVLDTDFELVNEGLVRVEQSVDGTLSDASLDTTANPIGALVNTAVTPTATTTYAEKQHTVTESMLYFTFNPAADWLELWQQWRSTGDMTNMELSSKLFADTMASVGNAMGKQLQNLFYNGDTASGVAATNRFDGLDKKTTADGDVVDVAGAVALTESNVVDALKGVYEAMPDKFLKDPLWKIQMSNAGYKLLQLANTDAKKTTTGVLNVGNEFFFNEKQIVPMSDIADDTIYGIKGTAGKDSNLLWLYWVDPNKENPLIGRVAANSRIWFVRIDMKMGMGYREGTEIVKYKP